MRYTLEMSTFSFHRKCRPFLFIGNVDILFSWEMSTFSFHQKCRPCLSMGNVDPFFSLEMSTFSFHRKCRPFLFIRNVDPFFSLEISTLSFHRKCRPFLFIGNVDILFSCYMQVSRQFTLQVDQNLIVEMYADLIYHSQILRRSISTKESIYLQLIIRFFQVFQKL